MSETSHLHALVRQLGEKLGVAGLTLDENGSASVQVDEQFILHFQQDETRPDLLILYAELGVIEHNLTQVCEALLSANLFWRDTDGATLALEPETQTVVLLHQELVADLEYAEFEKLLEIFTDQAEYWTQQLGELQNLEASDPVNVAELDSSPLGSIIRA